MNNLEMPIGLSDKGIQAYRIITKFLKKNGLTNTGGKAFYSPQAWEERGEDYGTDSLLVIVYDGGDHGCAFSYDRECYGMIEEMDKELRKIGVYHEQGCCWYGSIYES